MILHRTKQWDTMFISSMTDEHLKNTVNFILKRIKLAIEIITAPMTDSVDMILSGMKFRKIKAGTEDKLRSYVESLSNYSTELLIRWINMQEEYKTAFGRWEATKTMELPHIEDDDDEDGIDIPF